MSTNTPNDNVSEVMEPTETDAKAAAALTICESLLLALNDREILPEREIICILRDAAATHTNDSGVDRPSKLNIAVAALINQIIDGGNSVRRT
jgi:hypothetical protein